MYGAISKDEHYTTIAPPRRILLASEYLILQRRWIVLKLKTFLHQWRLVTPLERADRCETTPNLAQEDSTIGMVDQVSSCESTSVRAPFSCSNLLPVEVCCEP
uniref:Uncharacterized protein n=1 Tax=Chenopodium quinoa TaxID=63459 RepID=A0A803MDB8_CHEQI